MPPIDLPPKGLWLPPKPAIIRAVEEPSRAAFPMPTFVPALSVPWGLVYVGKVTASSATGTGYTQWADVPIGDPAPGRHLLILAITGRSGAHDQSGLTIDGVAATHVPNTPTPGSWHQIELYYLKRPAGETAAIRLNYSATPSSMGIHVFNLNGAPSGVPYQANVKEGGNWSSTTSTAIDIPENGTAIWAFVRAAGSGTPSWAGGYGLEGYVVNGDGLGIARRDVTEALDGVTQSVSWGAASGHTICSYTWGPA